MREQSFSVTCHHYQYREETEVVANNEHLPSSPMRGEIGNQGIGRPRGSASPQQALPLGS